MEVCGCQGELTSPALTTQGKPVDGLYKFHALITTYEIVMADASEFRKIHWKYLVVDEAHRLKNKV